MLVKQNSGKKIWGWVFRQYYNLLAYTFLTWVTSAATIAREEETEALTDLIAVFSSSVQVKVTLMTVWMRVKIEQDTGFWDTRDTTVVVMEMTAEHSIACRASTFQILSKYCPNTFHTALYN